MDQHPNDWIPRKIGFSFVNLGKKLEIVTLFILTTENNQASYGQGPMAQPLRAKKGRFWEDTMNKHIIAAAIAVAGFSSAALADGHSMTVGVSWSNFQEERWKTDEAAIKGALEAAGAKYVSADAQSSSAKQLSDVESLIAQGVDALIILAQDSAAIGPAIEAASAEGIPVVGYDRLIEDSRAFYLTFDNVEVGRMQARAVFEAAPTGRYVMIKGSPTDPNADFLRGGQQEILQAAIDSGAITIVDEAYTDGWLPANAQRNMEQILTANDNGVDAVVASNDGTAGGVVAALTAQGMEGIPVSGQDGDHAALNRVALGTQTVSVWKDARDLGAAAGEIAVALAKSDGDMSGVSGQQEWTSPGGTKMTARFLSPVPVTAANLSAVVDAGWITQEALCQGVTNGPAPCN
jgi:D-xylose transport system substrate-binding protein